MSGFKLLAFILFALSSVSLAHAATYTLPNGPLPSGCNYNGVEVVCSGNLIFGNNDTVNVTQPVTLTISGDFTFGNGFAANEFGQTSDLNIVVAGNMNPSNNAIINANLTVAGSINAGNNGEFTGGLIVSGNLNLGNNSTVEGNIQVNGTLNTGQNVNIDGNIEATNVNIGQNNIINGDIEAENVNINGSNSVINGDVDATGSVNNNGTINGDVDSPNVNDNSGGINGETCDEVQNIEDPSDVGCSGAGDNVAYFQLTHSGTALTCEAYSVTVTACAEAGCATQFAFTGSVEVAEAASGFAAATANFNNSSQTTVNLAIPNSGNYTLVTQNPVGEVPASATQCVSSSGCGVTAVDTALRFSGEAPVTAGDDFNLNLEAIRTDTNTGACGAALQGSQTVDFGLTCDDPGSCSDTNTYPQAALTIAGQTVAPTGTTGVPVSFDSNGVATLAVNYGDVGRIILSAATTAPTAATLTGTSTPFVVKPAGAQFVVSGNQAETYNGSSLPGVFRTAGETFSVQLQAINSRNEVTPNFGNEASAEALVLVNHALIAPAGGASGTLAGQSSYTVSGFPAVFSFNNLNYNEVGIIELEANVDGGDYLGAGAITADPNLRTSVPVGRFIPAYFDALPNAPVLQHAQDDFTYYGQATTFAINPEWEWRAYSTDGERINNYIDDFYRLGITDSGTVDNQVSSSSNLPTGSALLDLGSASYLVSGAQTSGQPLGIAISNAALTFTKTPTPQLPQQADYTLSVAAALLTDADGVCFATQAQPGTCLSLNLTNNTAEELLDSTGTELLDGILWLEDAFGVDNEPLTVPLAVATYTDIGGDEAYRVNQRDNSTPITTAWLQNLSCGSDSLNLVPDDLPSTFSQGRNDTDFVVSGASTACEAFWQPDLNSLNLDYLRRGYQGNTLVDPNATLYFGRYRGNDRIIFWRETGW